MHEDMKDICWGILRKTDVCVMVRGGEVETEVGLGFGLELKRRII